MASVDRGLSWLEEEVDVCCCIRLLLRLLILLVLLLLVLVVSLLLCMSTSLASDCSILFSVIRNGSILSGICNLDNRLIVWVIYDNLFVMLFIVFLISFWISFEVLALFICVGIYVCICKCYNNILVSITCIMIILKCIV